MSVDVISNSNNKRSGKSEKVSKEELKEEAARLGISVDELKKQRRKAYKAHKATREAELLQKEAQDSYHAQEQSRMTSWSVENKKTKVGEDSDVKSRKREDDDNEDDADTSTKRRRTRSMDAAEEKALLKTVEVLSPDQWRVENSITVRKINDRSYAPPAPYQRFSDAPFSTGIQMALKNAGFDKPTPIQAQAWPIALSGSDMISIAKTGSGKTCGYLLPSIQNYINENPDYSKATPSSRFGPPTAAGRGSGGGRYGGRGGQGRGGYVQQQRGTSIPFLLVLAPTRELACQILVETQKFCRDLHLRAVCCYGGSPKGPQIGAIERGVDCIIATPGRLNDLLEMGKVSLSGIKFVVLDEADRMLDMGFEPQIRSVMKHVPEQRQTLLFSATWPKEIQRLAYDFLKDPVQVNVGEVDSLNANKDITQKILMISEMEKYDKLVEILSDLTKDSEAVTGGQAKQQHTKLIVFVAKKVTCDELANRLWDNGFAVDSLHGDRAQWERTKVISAFKAGTLRVLIATDVAARGLDVKDVGVVINFDMPAGTNAVEDYVHRIGRTGRAGQKGIAYTFFTHQDNKCARQLVEVLQSSGQEIPEALQTLARPRFSTGWGGRSSGGRGRGGRSYGGRGGGRGYHGSGRGRFLSGRGGRGGY